VSRSDQIATAESGAGRVQAIFAFDNWVMVDAAGRSVQERCRSARELRDVLVALGVPAAEATSTADELWAARPKDASGRDVRIRESRHASTGLSPIQFMLLIGAFIALVIYLILHFAAGIPLP
jgi:hypothetical protein